MNRPNYFPRWSFVAIICVSIAPFSGLVSPVLASILVQYDFTGETGSQASTPADFVISSLSASGITRGAGLTASAGAGSVNSSAWTTAASPDAADYYEFTLTPNAGFELDVDSIAFGERRSATGIRNFTIRSSLDGFAANVITPVSVPDDALDRNQSFALSSSFDNLVAAVAFRIYGYTSEAGGGTWRLINNTNLGAMQIDGSIDPVTAQVPEAGALFVWALICSSALTGWRRCRQLI